MSTTRTITLTSRPPVTISEENWPVIASASDSEHDGQVEYQANCKSKWWVKVRQHDDGRALVYAGYRYDSVHQGDRVYDARRGVLLDAGATPDVICEAIREVCDDIAAAECDGDDAIRWRTLSDDCIADMPAEELA